jgi:anti-sigma factor RsiW
MKSNEHDALIEGCLSEPDAAMLSTLLEQSAKARARYWETASIHGLLEHTIQSASLRAVTGHASPVTPNRSSWFAWRPLAAAAAGVPSGCCACRSRGPSRRHARW